MNNPVSSPAAASRAGETHLLDLTSVCVASGTVRLPLSLQGYFAEGEIVALADGVELELQFQAPRTLAGLADFFARNELKANDRVRFEFAEGGLRLGAVRRERRRSAATAVVTQSTAAAATGSGAHVAAGDVQRQKRAQPGGGLVGEEPGGGEEAYQVKVRAVKRVRIEGGTPPRQDLAAPQPIDRASSRDVWARRQYPAWRPLDTTDGNPPDAPQDHDSAYSETTVRVVRRSRQDGQAKDLASRLDHESAAAPREAEATPAAAPSYASEWPLVSRGRVGDKPRQAAPTADLDPYLDAPLDVDREAEHARHAARAAAALPGQGASDRMTNIQQQPTNRAFGHQETEAVAAATRGGASQRERLGGLLGRLGLTRSAGPRRSQQHQVRDDDADAEFGYEAQHPSGEPTGTIVYTDQSVWPLAAKSDGDIARSLLAEPDFPASTEVAATPVDPGAASVAAADVTAASRANMGAAPPVPLPPSPPPGENTVDTMNADIQLLEQYLAEPETAAIVRCEDLAQRLGLDYARVARAFQRMAEDRDRYTPLRGDAYMVKRAR